MLLVFLSFFLYFTLALAEFIRCSRTSWTQCSIDSKDCCGIQKECGSPFTMCDSAVNTLSFCFLGTIIIQDLESSVVSAKAQQRLKKFNLPKSIMVHFYTPVIESMLTSCATMWYPGLTAKQRADCRPSSSLLRAAACSQQRGPAHLQDTEQETLWLISPTSDIVFLKYILPPILAKTSHHKNTLFSAAALAVLMMPEASAGTDSIRPMASLWTLILDCYINTMSVFLIVALTH